MKNIASYIDHTILKPDTNIEQVRKVCQEAREYKFASVCVNPYYVKAVKDFLDGSEVKVTSVIGFPLGCTMKEVKAFETKMAVMAGANELDMVINIAALKNKNYDIVLEDIQAVVKASEGMTVKVIIETCLLTDEEKVKACELSVEAGADFVKTSTGFSTGGATEEDVRLMKDTVGDKAKVKASGGIRDYSKAVQLVFAGAERLGCSASVAIATEKESDSEGY
jgi:deoxyribose-phosphate aldolase